MLELGNASDDGSDFRFTIDVLFIIKRPFLPFFLFDIRIHLIKTMRVIDAPLKLVCVISLRADSHGKGRKVDSDEFATRRVI